MNQEPREFSDLEEFTEEQLGFSPLSSGLGLLNKGEKKGSALGAQSAAPLQRPASAAEIKAVQQKLAAAKLADTEKTTAPTQRSAIRQEKSAPAIEKVTAPSAIQDPAAHPILRFSAFVVDLAIPTAALYFVYRWQIQNLSAVVPLRTISTELTLLLTTYFIGYFLISESLGGQSLGKMLFRLRVVEDDKYQKPISLVACLRRILILPLATLSLSWGLISSFWEPKLRPWQDRFTGTIVRLKKT